LVASDELFHRGSFQFIQNHFIERETSWIQQNFFLVMKTIFNLPNYEKLQRYCVASFCKDPLPILSSNDFLSLDKDILYSLLKRDELQIKEILIWDSLIKWGVNQIPELRNKPNNRNEWTNKNHEDLKNLLGDLIPLIQFLDIPPDDFYDKVHPYPSSRLWWGHGIPFEGYHPENNHLATLQKDHGIKNYQTEIRKRSGQLDWWKGLFSYD